MPTTRFLPVWSLALVLLVAPAARADEDRSDDPELRSRMPEEIQLLVERIETMIRRFFGFSPEAPLPPRGIERRHTSAFRDLEVNGRRAMTLERDGSEYTFRVERDGSIAGRMETPERIRVFSYSSEDAMRRGDPEIHRVYRECAEPRRPLALPEPGFGACPAPRTPEEIRREVAKVFERARADVDPEFERAFRRMEGGR